MKQPETQRSSLALPSLHGPEMRPLHLIQELRPQSSCFQCIIFSPHEEIISLHTLLLCLPPFADTVGKGVCPINPLAATDLNTSSVSSLSLSS